MTQQERERKIREECVYLRGLSETEAHLACVMVGIRCRTMFRDGCNLSRGDNELDNQRINLYIDSNGKVGAVSIG